MPSPGNEAKPRPRFTVEDKVRAMLELIDSGHESYTEWLTIQKLYDKLCSMKQTSRVKNIKQMIEPVLNKFGYHVGA